MFDRRLLSNFDWVLLGLVFLICGLGLVALHSATVGSAEMAIYRNRQVFWMLMGLVVIFFTVLLDYRRITEFAYVFHAIVVVLLVCVSLFGTGGPGSPVERWLAVGPIFIQPSEFAKYSLVLVLAQHFSESRCDGTLGIPQLVWPSLLMGVPFLLILHQPDLGTAMLLLFIFVPMIFLAGLRIRTLLLLATVFCVSTPLAWHYVLKPYQQDRIKTFMDPERDPLGTGYHVIQSKIAVGSGQLMGKGFEQGTQGKLNFLPAHHTDFIFAVFAEEWGLVGATIALILFILLFLWICFRIFNTRDRTGVFIMVGVMAIMASHVMVNIGMVTGVMPVVGVPLPFFSYGGSAILSMMFGIGLLLNVQMRRFTHKPVSLQKRLLSSKKNENESMREFF